MGSDLSTSAVASVCPICQKPTVGSGVFVTPPGGTRHHHVCWEIRQAESQTIKDLRAQLAAVERERDEAYASHRTYCVEMRDLLRQITDRAEQAETALAGAVEAALNAKLPAHFQWGRDAMEQFEFGKKRAAEAIKSSLPDAAKRVSAVLAAAKKLDVAWLIDGGNFKGYPAGPMTIAAVNELHRALAAPQQEETGRER